MTAKQIINGWIYNVLHERQQNKVFPNVYLGRFEADILEITKAGYSTEYEVKISRSDFKADAKKAFTVYDGKYNKSKSPKFEAISKGERTNYFYYVVPAWLITADEVPEFAGLIYAKFGSSVYSAKEVERMFFTVIKPAPKLTKDKFSADKLIKCYESTYYRFHTLRIK